MRYECNYGAGADTIFYSFKKNEFYSFEQDDIGFNECYTSRTGLSGGGYFDTNEHIPLGYVRIDCKAQQKPEILYTCDDVKIFSYVTIKSHQGICGNPPILILSDGENILFLDIKTPDEYNKNPFFKLFKSDYNKFKAAMTDWEQFWKEQNHYSEHVVTFEEEIYNNDLEKTTLNFNVLNYQSYKGWNLKRFINIPDNCKYQDEYDNKFKDMVLLKSHNIGYINREFVVVGFRNTIVFKSEHLTECLEYQGFSSINKDIYYKLKDIQGKKTLYGFKIMQGLKKYKNDNKWNKWFEYESEINYFQGVEKLEDNLNEGIKHKIRMDAVLDIAYHLNANDIFLYLKLAKFKKASIKYSLLAGNCEFGTKNFLKKYNINTTADNEVIINDLIKNKENFKSMCKDIEFKKVIAFLKLKKSVNGKNKKEKIKVLYDNYVEKANDWNQNHSFDGYGFDNIRLEPCEFSEFTKDYYNKYKNNFYRIYANEYDLISHISANLSLDKLTEEIEYIMRDI